MKKSLLLLLCLGLFSFTTTAQEQQPEESHPSISQNAGMLISQLKAQLGAQLKDQLESRLKTEFETKSNKELNVAIDSMLMQLDEIIEQANNFPKDSLALINSFMQNFNFTVNEQESNDGELFEIDELMEFYDTIYSETVQMRKKLKSIRKIRNKDKKAQQLSGTIINFFNESGFWDLMEMMMDRMMSFAPDFSEKACGHSGYSLSIWEALLENSGGCFLDRVSGNSCHFEFYAHELR